MKSQPIPRGMEARGESPSLRGSTPARGSGSPSLSLPASPGDEAGGPIFASKFRNSCHFDLGIAVVRDCRPLVWLREFWFARRCNSPVRSMKWRREKLGVTNPALVFRQPAFPPFALRFSA